MFTTPCFIRKCTPELKSKLEDIGYHRRPIKEKYDKHKFLLVYRDGCYNSSTGNETGTENYIDCGENEELFLAIAALRDDSNEHQWFIWDDDENEGYKWKLYDGNSNWSWWIFEVHKATIEELIENLKK